MKLKFILFAIIFISVIVNAQEVKINNNLIIEADGTIRMDSSATVWNGTSVKLDKGSNSASLQYLSGSNGPEIWYFRNNSTVEGMSFTVQMPHGWKEGSTIYPDLYWTPRVTSLAGEDIEWNFEYSWVNISATPQAIPSATTCTVISYGPFTANSLQKKGLTTAGISGIGKSISSLLICRIWRNSSNPSDTYPSDAGVLSVDFDYEMDTYGSRTKEGK